MSVSVTTGRLTLDELVALFTGETIGDIEFTTPCFTVALALEVAKRCDPISEAALRKRFYGDWAVDDVPQAALEMIGLAYQRYRQERAWLR